MAYGPEQHTDEISYEVVIDHTSGARFTLAVSPTVYLPNGGTAPTEATRDALFQAMVTRLTGLSGVTIASATKRGTYAAQVT